MKHLTRPSRPFQRLFKEASLYSIVTAVGSAVIGITSALRYFNKPDPHPLWGWITIGATLIVVTCICAKEIVTWKEKSRSSDTHDLNGCLHTLHAVLMGDWKMKTNPCLRVTVHLVVDEGQNIEQLVDYVGDDRRLHTARRVFPAYCGITGQALQADGLVVARRTEDDYSSYLKTLQQTYKTTGAGWREGHRRA